MITLGKMDGSHFSFSFDRIGNWTMFVPPTRFNRCSYAFGFGWRPVGVTEIRPFVCFFRIGERRTLARMYHLRYPYNVVRVGDWRVS